MFSACARRPLFGPNSNAERGLCLFKARCAVDCIWVVPSPLVSQFRARLVWFLPRQDSYAVLL